MLHFNLFIGKGRVADSSGIHFKVLNKSKGPAVWGPRAQCDREQYKLGIQQEISTQENLSVYEATIEDIVVKDNCIVGVITGTGDIIKCGSVVLTTGTFLGGVVHVGTEQFNAGRMGEASVTKLADTLLSHGFPLSRLRTGTPPRIDKKTINVTDLEPQPSDIPPSPFSFLTSSLPQTQFITCYRTQTTLATQNVVTSNLTYSPKMIDGSTGVGPRYCPSLETKVTKFPDRNHPVWLEPESFTNNQVYPNGLSTALPLNLQVQMLRVTKCF